MKFELNVDPLALDLPKIGSSQMNLNDTPCGLVCGANPILPSMQVGCGGVIYTVGDLYRCTDCAVPFHRECAKKHFVAKLSIAKGESE